MASSSNQAIFLLSFLLCGALLGGAGCSAVTSEEPPLADSTFTRVLVDLHMATARGGQFSTFPTTVTDSVFAHHNVRREAVTATLQYYSRRPEAFDALYNGVIDTLNALQSRSLSRPSGVPDSVRQRMDRSRPGVP
jgi:hypothetical protein